MIVKYRLSKQQVLLTTLLSVCVVSPMSAGEVDMDLSKIGISNTAPNAVSKIQQGGLTAEQAAQKLKSSEEAAREEIRQQFCDQRPTTELCSTIPNDNTDFSELFVYMFITASAQNSFDVFSWQSFISMNWPVESDGKTPLNKLDSNPNNARVWSAYKTPRQIFDPSYQDAICGSMSSADDDITTLHTDTFLQTGGKPLIDKNLNFVVYDLRINPEMERYILDNQLDTLEGQIAFQSSGKEIDFPLGRYDDPATKTGGSAGSAAIKTAWKVIDPASGDDPSRYFTIRGRIPVSAEDSSTGTPFCVETELGLVGMHIMRRTESGNGRQWIWSTFEHVDNAPLAANSRRPADMLDEVLFEQGCKAPATLDKSYAFFNESCTDCETNTATDAAWKWSPEKPHARSAALDNVYGTQVVRCWRIFEGTQLVNTEFQKKLQGSAWSSYASTSAQWKGANAGMLFPHGEVPRFLTNTTMETFGQDNDNGTCLGCHAAARTSAGQDSKFSFFLSLVSRYNKDN